MPGGRPTKLTPRVRATILEGIRAGLALGRACERAGVHDATYRRWILRGEQEAERIADGESPDPDERRYYTFRTDATRARAEGLTTLVAQVRLAASDDWRAASWLLSVLDPDTYGKRVNLAGEDGGPVNVRVTWQEGENAE